jgi:RHS repeat-associated protein
VFPRSRFTGKERDAESGNDYFPARYYASSMGRFLSPDPSGLYMADPENPQMLNLYSYVGNNPLRYTDPLGLSKDCGGGGDPSVVCIVTSAWDWLKDHLGGGSSNQGQSGQSNPSAGGAGGQGPVPGYTLSPGVSTLFTSRNRDEVGIFAARNALGPTSQKDPNGGCPQGCKYEWGGRILKDKAGWYSFTNPVTFKSSIHFWPDHVMIPFGYRKAGSYHTHPGNGAPGMSGNPGDAGWADSQHLPEYMGEEMSGRVWKYAGDNSCSAEPCGTVISEPNHP